MTNPRGGPVLPVAESTDAPIGGAALPVTLLTSIPADRRLEGGPARPVVYISDAQVAAGYLVQGGNATPIYAVTDGRPTLGGRPQPVYVVGGSGPIPPDDEPLAGFVLWLNPTYRANSVFQDAARTTPAGVGDPIGGLYDATTAITATASGAARPLRTVTGMSVDGAQSLIIPIGALVDPLTIYMVIDAAPQPDIQFLTVNVAGDAAQTFIAGGASALTVQGGLVSGASVVADPVVICIVFNGVSSSVTVNANEVTGTATALSGSNLYWGSYLGSAGIIGELREILIYDAAHDAPTRAAEIAKAAARNGVAL